MVAINTKTPALGKTAASTVAKKPSTKKNETAEPKSKSKVAAATESKQDIVKSPAVKVTAKKVATQKPVVEKSTAVKKVAAKKKVAEKSAVAVSPEHRYHMIATAAYFLAERRGFAGGYEMQDWITAEAEVDAQLNQ